MIVLIIFLSLLLIFYLSLFLGKYLTSKNQYVKRIGESIYEKKIKQYHSSSFKPLRNAIDNNSIAQGMGFIAPMIILKSIAFYFISMLLIAPLIIILQGLAMGSMFVYHKKQKGGAKELASITFWQLLSHLIVASYSTLTGINWLLDQTLIANLEALAFLDLKQCAIISFITAIVAAFLEARALLNSKLQV